MKREGANVKFLKDLNNDNIHMCTKILCIVIQMIIGVRYDFTHSFCIVQSYHNSILVHLNKQDNYLDKQSSYLLTKLSTVLLQRF